MKFSWQTIRADLLYAKKAVAAAVTIEGTAVGLGLLDNAQAGYITAALGAVTSLLVFALRNVPKAVKVALARPARPRLGKLPAVPIAKCARLEPHMSPDLPEPPATLNWAAHLTVVWGMMLNDRLGDCTCAAVGHAIQLLTAVAKRAAVTLTDAQILALYEAVSGYDPQTGANDNGAVEADVLARWRSAGVNGHSIAAYGRIDHRNVTAVKQAIALLGFVYVGTQVPSDWEQAPDVWDVSPSQIVGGHAIIFVGWDETGFTLVSWGQLFTITYAAYQQYVDEVWGVVSPDWMETDGDSPGGLDVAALTADLDALGRAA